MASQEGSPLRLQRGFLVADRLWQQGVDVAEVNRLMKTPDFRGLYQTKDFVPTSLRRKRMLPLLPKDPDDPRLEEFTAWFLESFTERKGAWDGSALPEVKEALRSSPQRENVYTMGHHLATTQPEFEYWEGYALRKGAATHHAWNVHKNKVVDLVWYHAKAHEDVRYLGVPVDTDFLKWCQVSPHPVSYLYWAKLTLDGKF
jgi:hypothetical protein